MKNLTEHFQKQMDRFWDDLRSSKDMDFSISSLKEPAFTPMCDVTESDTDFFMSFDLPGVKKEDIKINLTGSDLTVSGERREEFKEKNRKQTRSERFYGMFERTFHIPSGIKPEQIQAVFENGVLRMTFPKTDTLATHAITIGEGKLEGFGKSKTITVDHKIAAA